VEILRKIILETTPVKYFVVNHQDSQTDITNQVPAHHSDVGNENTNFNLLNYLPIILMSAKSDFKYYLPAGL